jgi:hypothetical protein
MFVAYTLYNILLYCDPWTVSMKNLFSFTAYRIYVEYSDRLVGYGKGSTVYCTTLLNIQYLCICHKVCASVLCDSQNTEELFLYKELTSQSLR